MNTDKKRKNEQNWPLISSLDGIFKMFAMPIPKEVIHVPL
jgi:hypothetical protein